MGRGKKWGYLVAAICAVWLFGCAQIQVCAGNEPGCRIETADSLSENADAQKLHGQLEEDIARLKEAGIPAVAELSISIVEGKTAICDDGSLECSVADLTGKAYRPFLVEAWCGVREPWIGYGVSGYIFGEKVDEAFLFSWYRDTGNMGTLRLSGIRFFPEWVTAEEGKAARQTAVSLASMLIEESGFSWIGSPVVDSAKQRWLSSIGVDTVYEDAYTGYLDGYRFDATGDYLIRISDDAASYTFYDPVGGAKNAEEIETFLYRERCGKEKIYRYLREEGGAAFAEVIRKEENIPFIRYTLRKDGESRLYGDREKIALNGSVFGHLGYWLHSIKKTKGVHWYHGALVTYINMIYAEDDYCGDSIQQLWETGSFFSDDADTGAEADEAVHRNMEAYLSQREISVNRAMVDACAAVSLFEQVPLNQRMDATYIEMYRLKEKDVRSGDELTLIRATSFFAWLTDEYTLEKSLQLCSAKAPDYEKLFGDSYDALKARWQDSLKTE